MRRTLWIIGLIASALIGVRATAGEGSPPRRRSSRCRGAPSNMSARPWWVQRQMGLIQECLVRPGDRVKGGQVLGRLFNQDVLAELEALTVALEISETTIRQKEAALVVERAKLRRDEKLFSQNSAVSMESLQIQQLAVRTAELDLQAAIQNRRMAEGQMNQGKAMVDAREIVSPHDGIVTEIYINAGEAIQYEVWDPTYEYYFGIQSNIRKSPVDTYCLRFTRWSTSTRFGSPDTSTRAMHGASARGRPSGSRPSWRAVTCRSSGRPSRARLLSSTARSTRRARTCRVFAEVENRGGLLRSGLECRMEIDLRNHPGIKADATRPVPARPECVGAPSAIPGSVPGPSLPGLPRNRRIPRVIIEGLIKMKVP